MNGTTYKGYVAKIDYDGDDEIFTGRLAGINDGAGFHADTVADLKVAFHEAVDDYIAACAAIGRDPERPSPGKIVL